MNPRPKRGPRLYTRERGGAPRYYADLRSVGRGRVPLIPGGETQATTDPVIAQKMLTDLLKEIQETRRDGALLGVKRRTTLQAYVSEHLVKKAQSGRVTPGHLDLSELHLRAAIDFFGAERELHTITVDDVQRFARHLAALPNRRGQGLAQGTQRKYLNALSNLYRRAGGEGLVPPGYNPIAGMMDKPIAEQKEANWLEVWEAALLLEAARTYKPAPVALGSAGDRLVQGIRDALGSGRAADEEFVRRMREAGKGTTLAKLNSYRIGEARPGQTYFVAAEKVLGLRSGSIAGAAKRAGTFQIMPFAYPLIAAFLLTGGRESEVTGLEIGDVSLHRKAITFRVNPRRRLKTRTSYRTVPYWPQLQEILEPHVEELRRSGARENDLVFPSPRTGAVLQNVRTVLDIIAGRVGWEPGQIRTKAFRHTYCAARLQTLDHGAAVSVFTVGRELGHGGDALVRRIYGHLGEVRHRSAEVEYRLEQHREAIPTERLRALLQVV